VPDIDPELWLIVHGGYDTVVEHAWNPDTPPVVLEWFAREWAARTDRFSGISRALSLNRSTPARALEYLVRALGRTMSHENLAMHPNITAPQLWWLLGWGDGPSNPPTTSPYRRTDRYVFVLANPLLRNDLATFANQQGAPPWGNQSPQTTAAQIGLLWTDPDADPDEGVRRFRLAWTRVARAVTLGIGKRDFGAGPMVTLIKHPLSAVRFGAVRAAWEHHDMLPPTHQDDPNPQVRAAARGEETDYDPH